VLFGNLEVAKLTLLASAISSPILLVIIAMGTLLLYPRGEKMSWAAVTANPFFSQTVLAGIVLTLFVLSGGGVLLLRWNILSAMQRVLSGSARPAILLAAIWIDRFENRRLARRPLQQSNTPE